MAASIPNSLKAIKPFLIISTQLEAKNPVVSYYVRLYGIQEGLGIGKNDPTAKAYLLGAMDKLSELKKRLRGDEALSNDTVGQAYVEEYALNLFNTADAKDRAAEFTKGVSKAFYTASQLFVTLKQFGEPSEEIEGKMKYAKWKAVEIDRCLKNGITPTPGPPGGFDDPTELEVPPIQPPGSHGYQPGNYGDQPGSSGFHNEQQEPTGSYGNPQPQQIGFDLPPPVPFEPGPLPQLPPEIKPVPRPRHDVHPTPPQPSIATTYEPPAPGGGVAKLGPAEATRAQKYCKFASSAIEYEDFEGALDYLTKATRLLKTGKEN